MEFMYHIYIEWQIKAEYVFDIMSNTTSLQWLKIKLRARTWRGYFDHNRTSNNNLMHLNHLSYSNRLAHEQNQFNKDFEPVYLRNDFAR